jgi:hypothetical protein
MMDSGFPPPDFVKLTGREAAERYVELIKRGDPADDLHWRILHDPKGDGQRSDPRKNHTGPLADHWDFFSDQQRDNWSPFLVLNTGGTKSDDILARGHVRAVCIDVDGTASFDETEWHLPPHFVVFRSDAYFHPYWIVEDVPVDQFVTVQKRLQRHYGSDPKVADKPTLIMRVPGFDHRKDPENPMPVALLDCSLDVAGDSIPGDMVRPYTREEITEGLPPVEVESRASRVKDLNGGSFTNYTEEHLIEALSYIDPTYGEDDRQWVGITKAVWYGQIPLLDRPTEITEEHRERGTVPLNPNMLADYDGADIADRFCSGELWRARTGDESFEVPTYGSAEVLKRRIGKDSDYPRDSGDVIRIGTIIHEAETNGYDPRGKGLSWIEVYFRKLIADGHPPSHDPLMDGYESAPSGPAKRQPRFQRTDKDKLCQNFHNAREAVRCLGPVPEYDRFNQRTVIRHGSDALTVDDDVTRAIRADILDVFHLELSRDHVTEALHTAALEHPFHPVQDFFDGLEWDGTGRLDTWLTDYFHVPNSPYTRAVGRKWLLGAVTRIYRPGAKFDFMLVFVGSQGVSKSKALRILSIRDEWFSDSPPEDLRPDNKDSILVMQGKLLVEFGELSGLKKMNRDTLKSFLSRQIDEARPPYGREPKRFPRQCVFAGSTNESEFLEDPTGARRFWPIELPEGTEIDLAGLRAARDQLWAEAVAAFKRGERAELPRELWTDAAAAQEQHHTPDPWEADIRRYLEGRAARASHDGGPIEPLNRVHTSTLMSQALGLSSVQRTTAAGRRIRLIMEKRLRWKYRQNLRIGSLNLAGYYRPDAAENESLDWLA